MFDNVNKRAMAKKIAFVFPGQGSQSVGMGTSLAARFSDFETVYKSYLQRADDALGFSLSKLIEKGPDTQLRLTEYTQPALLTLSSAMHEWVYQNEVKAEMGLGHSLGEYSALVASDAIDFESAVKLVHLRGQLMTQAVPAGVGGMAALIGASREEAETICKDFSNDNEVVEPSVVNSSGQIVVSGHVSAIEKLASKGKDLGIRKVQQLEVSGPFHCSLLKEAADQLNKAIAEVEIKKPRFTILSNATALPQYADVEIRENLTKQMYQPVLWEDCVRYAGDQGFETFVEVGPSKVLTGLIRKILPDAKCTPLDSIQKIELLAA
jgi:[acyl-carrier-protein] S-malonyltransferase